MTTQDHIRLLSSAVRELEALAFSIETHARLDCRVIRDGEIVDAPADLQMRRAAVIRGRAALIQGVVQSLEMPQGCNRDGLANAVGEARPMSEAPGLAEPAAFPGFHSKPHDPKTCPLCLNPDDYPCTCGNGCNPGMCTDERDFDEPVWEEA